MKDSILDVSVPLQMSKHQQGIKSVPLNKSKDINGWQKDDR